jgi:predicted metal-dependent peptidase
MQVLQVTQLVFQVWNRGGIITGVVLVIACDVDHMIELCCTVFKESVISVALGMLTHEVMHIAITEITSHTDVTAENENISPIGVVDFQWSKL